MKPTNPIAIVICLICIFLARHTGAAPDAEATVVQVDVSKLLNARVVTTFSDNKVIPLTINLDGAGGVATKAASDALKTNNDHTVPDDGKFAANADHPEIDLHFSNDDGKGFQVRRMPKEEDFSFDVPANKYARMFLIFTSGAAGPAPMQVTLTYQDKSTETRDIICPDWWTNLDDKNKDVVYVASNLAKFGTKNTILEKDHHNIFGIDIHPAKDKVLSSVKVHKTKPLVCFWGATGEVGK
jgi:hypothetical protein